MKKSFFIILFGFFAVSLWCTQTIHSARAAGVPVASCDLSASDFAAIKAIQNDPTLSVDDELNQELALRKQLLTQTISCAKNNDIALQKTLMSVSLHDAAATIQSQLSGKMNDAITFYNLELVKLQDAGLANTQAVAKEIFAWRASNDIPLAGQVNNLILWSQDQALFQVAQNRVTETSKLIAFIESATPNNDLQNSFNVAQSAFQIAENDNMTAQNDLAQFLPPDQSVAAIQQSLQSLATAYQKLADLNTMLQNLLPTTNS